MTRVKVAGVQSVCGPDRQENVARASGLARLAAENGAKIICFEQLFTTQFFPREASDEHFALAEKENGPTLEAMAGLARETAAALVCPVFEEDEEGRRFNTAFVLGPDGGLLGRYRKIHVPDLPLWRERHYFEPGDLGFPVFEAHGITFGVQICWDNFYPEGARALALKGAHVVFAPNAAAFASTRKWETVMAASAIVNGMYLFRVNRVGKEEQQDFYGRSFCVDPHGEMTMSPAGMADSVILADVDTDLIEDVRREWNFFADRREETYGT